MELKFHDRIRCVAGDAPYTWASQRGIKKSSMTSLLNTDRPQHRSLVMLEEKTGIPLQWWLEGDLPPPKGSGGAEGGAERQVVYPRHGEEPPGAAAALATPTRVPARINVDALAAIIEGALKTAPTASPQVIAAHCAKVYAQAIEDGLITPDGLGPKGALDAAA